MIIFRQLKLKNVQLYVLEIWLSNMSCNGYCYSLSICLSTDIYPLELVIKNVLTGTKNSLTEAATLTIWSGYQSRELRISDRVNTYTMFHMTESTLGTFFSSAELFINIHTVEK